MTPLLNGLVKGFERWWKTYFAVCSVNLFQLNWIHPSHKSFISGWNELEAFLQWLQRVYLTLYFGDFSHPARFDKFTDARRQLHLFWGYVYTPETRKYYREKWRVVFLDQVNLKEHPKSQSKSGLWNRLNLYQEYKSFSLDIWLLYKEE